MHGRDGVKGGGGVAAGCPSLVDVINTAGLAHCLWAIFRDANTLAFVKVL